MSNRTWKNMFEKHSMSRGFVCAAADRQDAIGDAGRPLSETERRELTLLLSDPDDVTANDLLAFVGASSVAGFLVRLAAASGDDQAVLLTAIRRALKARQR
jgi:hypothetical protein